MMIRVGYVQAPKVNKLSMGGGNAYRAHILKMNSESLKIEPLGLQSDLKRNRFISGAETAYKLLKLHGKQDIWIRDYLSIITLPYDRTEGINIGIIHHIDNKFLSYPLFTGFLDKIMYHNLEHLDLLVVVSKYWKDYFERKCNCKVEIIYNCFDFDEFKIKDADIVAFKEKYNLMQKPIIYLGNCQQSKGVVESYDALKDLDAYLVTSGQKRVEVPSINLNLGYQEYLLLLKSSSVVVTMSKMKEGWCRTAHEAMLCKTPVVGSGLGGMTELLYSGGQIICKDFNDLRGIVEYLLRHPEVGEKGYEYASQEKFSIDYFNNKWMTLFETFY